LLNKIVYIFSKYFQKLKRNLLRKKIDLTAKIKIVFKPIKYLLRHQHHQSLKVYLKVPLSSRFGPSITSMNSADIIIAV